MSSPRRVPLHLQPTRPAGSARAAAIAPFIAMDVMAEAKALGAAGASIVHLEVGQPGFPTPAPAREAAQRLLADGRIGYTEALGRPSLRARIARHYRETYGVEVAAERVVVTTGSSGGFVIAFLALFEPGARVAIATPGYPAYRSILEALGLEPVEIETSAAMRWALTAEAVEAAHREAPLAGALVMSPANPSGTMIRPEALADVAAVCRRLGIWLVSDEIYHGLTYAEPAATALAFDEEAVIVNSFSKYYCMTGWRVGWLVVPERLVRTLERLAQNLFISVPLLAQVAAEAVFDGIGELEAHKAAYARNRAFLLEALPRIGLDRLLPVDGAFYVYADVGRFTNDSVAFCKRMLAEAGVATTPGVDFDRARGSRYLRISFAGTEAEMREAVARLGRWLPRLER